MDDIPRESVEDSAAAKPSAGDTPPQSDSGLVCLAMLARFFDKPADYDQLRHRHGDPTQPADAIDLVRYAKEIGFKARCIVSSVERLARTPLPAIAGGSDGGWFILAKVAEDKALIQDPRVGRPEQLTIEQLEARWDDRLVLVATRAQLAVM
ncbi:MAG: cysteine peptidase family C39 domain-containing protein, partial [Alphaproteobacteria bacterium]